MFYADVESASLTLRRASISHTINYAARIKNEDINNVFRRMRSSYFFRLGGGAAAAPTTFRIGRIVIKSETPNFKDDKLQINYIYYIHKAPTFDIERLFDDL